MSFPLGPDPDRPVPPQAAGAADVGLVAPTDAREAAALKASAGLNFALALGEALVGLLIGSVALLAIAVDSLRDAAAAGLSLALAGRSRAAFRLATLILAAAAAIAFLAIIWLAFAGFGGRIPNPWLMIVVATISLVINLITAWRLRRFGEAEALLAAVWRQTRWDFLADIGVIVAALAVSDFARRWPDVVAGIAIALLSLFGIYRLVRASLAAGSEERR